MRPSKCRETQLKTHLIDLLVETLKSIPSTLPQPGLGIMPKQVEVFVYEQIM